jgi:hypothetical protein
MRGPMKLIDESSGLMECKDCGFRHNARLQPGLERADGVTNYYRGSYQCGNERCPSKKKPVRRKALVRRPDGIGSAVRLPDGCANPV